MIITQKGIVLSLIAILVIVLILLGVILGYYLLTQRSTVETLKQSIREGPYGKMPVSELYRGLIQSSGPSKGDMESALIIRKTETLPYLLSILKSGDEREIVNVLRILQSFRWKESSPDVISILKDHNFSVSVRIQAGGVAAIFGNREAVSELIEFLKISKNDNDRALCITALGYLGDKSVAKILEDVLSDSSPHIRARAAASLANLGSDAGLQVAIELSRDPNGAIRWFAIDALSEIASADAISRLEEIKKEDQNSDAGWMAQIGLHKIKIDSIASEQRLQYLVTLLDDPNGEIAAWAADRIFEDYPKEAEYVFSKKLPKTGSLLGPILRRYLLLLSS